MFESAQSFFLAVRKIQLNLMKQAITRGLCYWMTKRLRNHEPDLVFPYSDGGNYASKQKLQEYFDSKLNCSLTFCVNGRSEMLDCLNLHACFSNSIANGTFEQWRQEIQTNPPYSKATGSKEVYPSKSTVADSIK